MKIQYRILYKIDAMKYKYVSEYSYTKLDNGKTYIGAFKYTDNIIEAKEIPDNIESTNLLDNSVKFTSVTLTTKIGSEEDSIL
jgi:hypothetical protein